MDVDNRLLASTLNVDANSFNFFNFLLLLFMTINVHYKGTLIINYHVDTNNNFAAPNNFSASSIIPDSILVSTF
jgi:hypothetical protein